MSFTITISDQLVESDSLIYRDMGFGKPVSLETDKYKLSLLLRDAVSILSSDIDEFVNECKVDDESGDVEISELLEAGYPSSGRLVSEYPQLFCKIIEEYLYFNILEALLKNNHREDWRHAINSVTSVTISGESLVIAGEIYNIEA